MNLSQSNNISSSFKQSESQILPNAKKFILVRKNNEQQQIEEEEKQSNQYREKGFRT
jgi:hypothetical protein